MDDTGKIEQGQAGLSLARAARDCLACGVIFIDEHRQTVRLSPEAAKILGLEVHGKGAVPFDTLPPSLQAVAAEIASAGKPAAAREFEVAAGPRGTIPMRVSALPLPPDKRDSSMVLLLHDLGAAQQLEARIRQLDRLADIGTLAASMAHEIKNALVAGRTFIDLLLEKHQDAELVEIVRREMGRIDAIVSRMLNFARPARTAFGAVHLHEVIEHSLRLVEPQLQGKAVSFQQSFQAAPDLVLGDDYELQQALVNLLLNALEAMGQTGTLTVSTENVAEGGTAQTAEAPHLRVRITDTGVGIPAENLGRLFEPFFTTNPDGTGLGLPITQRIIQEHRGTISVESRPGEGTTFSIVLPVAPAG
jgi:signal transduction histidine kinase